MKQELHTILGANGAIGQAVIKALEAKKLVYRKVSRTQSGGENSKVADLLHISQTKDAIAESTHVYLCAGLPYAAKVWRTDWEIVMKHVIEACEVHQAKLIFLDNIYMYAPPLPVPFDENAPQNPPSIKGKARKRTADLMIEAIASGRIQGLIGRSADFFGEMANNSIFYISFLENMLRGKAPLSFAPIHTRHTYANTLDLGRALVELATQEDCYDQVWHLPVGKPVTLEEMLMHFNNELKTEFKVSQIPGFLRKLLAVFIPPLKEVGEMLYQFESAYVMSDEKFRKRFPDFPYTPYEEGVRQMIDWFKK
jgi:nucleoside-diphosphate-sugar epimerase